MQTVLLWLLRWALGAVLDGAALALSIDVWAGTLSIRNIRLRRDALAVLNLPFALVSGTVEEFNVQIPWRALLSRPVSIALRGAHVVIGSAARNRVAASPGGAVEPPGGSGPAAGDSAPPTPASSSFLEHRWLQTILHRLCIQVDDVSVTYVDFVSVATPKMWAAVGLRLASASLRPTDPAWSTDAPLTTPSPSTAAHRVVNVRGLAALLHHSDSAEPLLRRDQHGPSPWPDPQTGGYLLAPCTLRLRLRSPAVPSALAARDVGVDVDVWPTSPSGEPLPVLHEAGDDPSACPPAALALQATKTQFELLLALAAALADNGTAAGSPRTRGGASDGDTQSDTQSGTHARTAHEDGAGVRLAKKALALAQHAARCAVRALRDACARRVRSAAAPTPTPPPPSATAARDKALPARSAPPAAFQLALRLPSLRVDLVGGAPDPRECRPGAHALEPGPFPQRTLSTLVYGVSASLLLQPYKRLAQLSVADAAIVHHADPQAGWRSRRRLAAGPPSDGTLPSAGQRLARRGAVEALQGGAASQRPPYALCLWVADGPLLDARIAQETSHTEEVFTPPTPPPPPPEYGPSTSAADQPVPPTAPAADEGAGRTRRVHRPGATDVQADVGHCRVVLSESACTHAAHFFHRCWPTPAPLPAAPAAADAPSGTDSGETEPDETGGMDDDDRMFVDAAPDAAAARARVVPLPSPPDPATVVGARARLGMSVTLRGATVLLPICSEEATTPLFEIELGRLCVKARQETAGAAALTAAALDMHTGEVTEAAWYCGCRAVEGDAAGLAVSHIPLSSPGHHIARQDRLVRATAHAAHAPSTPPRFGSAAAHSARRGVVAEGTPVLDRLTRSGARTSASAARAAPTDRPVLFRPSSRCRRRTVFAFPPPGSHLLAMGKIPFAFSVPVLEDSDAQLLARWMRRNATLEQLRAGLCLPNHVPSRAGAQGGDAARGTGRPCRARRRSVLLALLDQSAPEAALEQRLGDAAAAQAQEAPTADSNAAESAATAFAPIASAAPVAAVWKPGVRRSAGARPVADAAAHAQPGPVTPWETDVLSPLRLPVPSSLRMCALRVEVDMPLTRICVTDEELTHIMWLIGYWTVPPTPARSAWPTTRAEAGAWGEEEPAAASGRAADAGGGLDLDGVPRVPALPPFRLPRSLRRGVDLGFRCSGVAVALLGTGDATNWAGRRIRSSLERERVRCLDPERPFASLVVDPEEDAAQPSAWAPANAAEGCAGRAQLEYLPPEAQAAAARAALKGGKLPDPPAAPEQPDAVGRPTPLAVLACPWVHIHAVIAGPLQDMVVDSGAITLHDLLTPALRKPPTPAQRAGAASDGSADADTVLTQAFCDMGHGPRRRARDGGNNADANRRAVPPDFAAFSRARFEDTVAGPLSHTRALLCIDVPTRDQAPQPEAAHLSSPLRLLPRSRTAARLCPGLDCLALPQVPSAHELARGGRMRLHWGQLPRAWAAHGPGAGTEPWGRAFGVREALVLHAGDLTASLAPDTTARVCDMIARGVEVLLYADDVAAVGSPSSPQSRAASALAADGAWSPALAGANAEEAGAAVEAAAAAKDPTPIFAAGTTSAPDQRSHNARIPAHLFMDLLYSVGRVRIAILHDASRPLAGVAARGGACRISLYDQRAHAASSFAVDTRGYTQDLAVLDLTSPGLRHPFLVAPAHLVRSYGDYGRRMWASGIAPARRSTAAAAAADAPTGHPVWRALEAHWDRSPTAVPHRLGTASLLACGGGAGGGTAAAATRAGLAAWSVRNFCPYSRGFAGHTPVVWARLPGVEVTYLQRFVAELTAAVSEAVLPWALLWARDVSDSAAFCAHAGTEYGYRSTVHAADRYRAAVVEARAAADEVALRAAPRGHWRGAHLDISLPGGAFTLPQNSFSAVGIRARFDALRLATPVDPTPHQPPPPAHPLLDVDAAAARAPEPAMAFRIHGLRVESLADGTRLSEGTHAWGNLTFPAALAPADADAARAAVRWRHLRLHADSLARATADRGERSVVDAAAALAEEVPSGARRWGEAMLEAHPRVLRAALRPTPLAGAPPWLAHRYGLDRMDEEVDVHRRRTTAANNQQQPQSGPWLSPEAVGAVGPGDRRRSSRSRKRRHSGSVPTSSLRRSDSRRSVSSEVRSAPSSPVEGAPPPDTVRDSGVVGSPPFPASAKTPTRAGTARHTPDADARASPQRRREARDPWQVNAALVDQADGAQLSADGGELAASVGSASSAGSTTSTSALSDMTWPADARVAVVVDSEGEDEANEAWGVHGSPLALPKAAVGESRGRGASWDAAASSGAPSDAEADAELRSRVRQAPRHGDESGEWSSLCVFAHVNQLLLRLRPRDYRAILGMVLQNFAEAPHVAGAQAPTDPLPGLLGQLAWLDVDVHCADAAVAMVEDDQPSSADAGAVAVRDGSSSEAEDVDAPLGEERVALQRLGLEAPPVPLLHGSHAVLSLPALHLRFLLRQEGSLELSAGAESLTIQDRTGAPDEVPADAGDVPSSERETLPWWDRVFGGPCWRGCALRTCPPASAPEPHRAQLSLPRLQPSLQAWPRGVGGAADDAIAAHPPLLSISEHYLPAPEVLQGALHAAAAALHVRGVPILSSGDGEKQAAHRTPPQPCGGADRRGVLFRQVSTLWRRVARLDTAPLHVVANADALTRVAMFFARPFLDPLPSPVLPTVSSRLQRELDLCVQAARRTAAAALTRYSARQQLRDLHIRRVAEGGALGARFVTRADIAFAALGFQAQWMVDPLVAAAASVDRDALPDALLPATGGEQAAEGEDSSARSSADDGEERERDRGGSLGDTPSTLGIDLSDLDFLLHLPSLRLVVPRSGLRASTLSAVADFGLTLAYRNRGDTVFGDGSNALELGLPLRSLALARADAFHPTAASRSRGRGDEWRHPSLVSLLVPFALQLRQLFSVTAARSGAKAPRYARQLTLVDASPLRAHFTTRDAELLGDLATALAGSLSDALLVDAGDAELVDEDSRRAITHERGAFQRAVRRGEGARQRWRERYLGPLRASSLRRGEQAGSRAFQHLAMLETRLTEAMALRLPRFQVLLGSHVLQLPLAMGRLDDVQASLVRQSVGRVDMRHSLQVAGAVPEGWSAASAPTGRSPSPPHPAPPPPATDPRVPAPAPAAEVRRRRASTRAVDLALLQDDLAAAGVGADDDTAAPPAADDGGKEAAPATESFAEGTVPGSETMACHASGSFEASVWDEQARCWQPLVEPAPLRASLHRYPLDSAPPESGATGADGAASSRFGADMDPGPHPASARLALALVEAAPAAAAADCLDVIPILPEDPALPSVDAQPGGSAPPLITEAAVSIPGTLEALVTPALLRLAASAPRLRERATVSTLRRGVVVVRNRMEARCAAWRAADRSSGSSPLWLKPQSEGSVDLGDVMRLSVAASSGAASASTVPHFVEVAKAAQRPAGAAAGAARVGAVASDSAPSSQSGTRRLLWLSVNVLGKEWAGSKPVDVDAFGESILLLIPLAEAPGQQGNEVGAFWPPDMGMAQGAIHARALPIRVQCAPRGDGAMLVSLTPALTVRNHMSATFQLRAEGAVDAGATPLAACVAGLGASRGTASQSTPGVSADLACLDRAVGEGSATPTDSPASKASSDRECALAPGQSVGVPLAVLACGGALWIRPSSAHEWTRIFSAAGDVGGGEVSEAADNRRGRAPRREESVQTASEPGIKPADLCRSLVEAQSPDREAHLASRTATAPFHSTGTSTTSGLERGDGAGIATCPVRPSEERPPHWVQDWAAALRLTSVRHAVALEELPSLLSRKEEQQSPSTLLFGRLSASMVGSLASPTHDGTQSVSDESDETGSTSSDGKSTDSDSSASDSAASDSSSHRSSHSLRSSAYASSTAPTSLASTEDDATEWEGRSQRGRSGASNGDVGALVHSANALSSGSSVAEAGGGGLSPSASTQPPARAQGGPAQPGDEPKRKRRGWRRRFGRRAKSRRSPGLSQEARTLTADLSRGRLWVSAAFIDLQHAFELENLLPRPMQYRLVGPSGPLAAAGTLDVGQQCAITAARALKHALWLRVRVRGYEWSVPQLVWSSADGEKAQRTAGSPSRGRAGLSRRWKRSSARRARAAAEGGTPAQLQARNVPLCMLASYSLLRAATAAAAEATGARVPMPSAGTTSLEEPSAHEGPVSGTAGSLTRSKGRMHAVRAALLHRGRKSRQQPQPESPPGSPQSDDPTQEAYAPSPSRLRRAVSPGRMLRKRSPRRDAGAVSDGEELTARGRGEAAGASRRDDRGAVWDTMKAYTSFQASLPPTLELAAEVDPYRAVVYAPVWLVNRAPLPLHFRVGPSSRLTKLTRTNRLRSAARRVMPGRAAADSAVTTAPPPPTTSHPASAGDGGMSSSRAVTTPPRPSHPPVAGTAVQEGSAVGSSPTDPTKPARPKRGFGQLLRRATSRSRQRPGSAAAKGQQAPPSRAEKPDAGGPRRRGASPPAAASAPLKGARDTASHSDAAWRRDMAQYERIAKETGEAALLASPLAPGLAALTRRIERVLGEEAEQASGPQQQRATGAAPTGRRARRRSLAEQILASDGNGGTEQPRRRSPRRRRGSVAAGDVVAASLARRPSIAELAARGIWPSNSPDGEGQSGAAPGRRHSVVATTSPIVASRRSSLVRAMRRDSVSQALARRPPLAALRGQGLLPDVTPFEVLLVLPTDHCKVEAVRVSNATPVRDLFRTACSLAGVPADEAAFAFLALTRRTSSAPRPRGAALLESLVQAADECQLRPSASAVFASIPLQGTLMCALEGCEPAMLLRARCDESITSGDGSHVAAALPPAAGGDGGAAGAPDRGEWEREHRVALLGGTTSLRLRAPLSLWSNSVKPSSALGGENANVARAELDTRRAAAFASLTGSFNGESVESRTRAASAAGATPSEPAAHSGTGSLKALADAAGPAFASELVVKRRQLPKPFRRTTLLSVGASRLLVNHVGKPVLVALLLGARRQGGTHLRDQLRDAAIALAASAQAEGRDFLAAARRDSSGQTSAAQQATSEHEGAAKQEAGSSASTGPESQRQSLGFVVRIEPGEVVPLCWEAVAPLLLNRGQEISQGGDTGPTAAAPAPVSLDRDSEESLLPPPAPAPASRFGRAMASVRERHGPSGRASTADKPRHTDAGTWGQAHGSGPKATDERAAGSLGPWRAGEAEAEPYVALRVVDQGRWAWSQPFRFPLSDHVSSGNAASEEDGDKGTGATAAASGAAEQPPAGQGPAGADSVLCIKMRRRRAGERGAEARTPLFVAVDARSVDHQTLLVLRGVNRRRPPLRVANRTPYPVSVRQVPLPASAGGKVVEWDAVGPGRSMPYWWDHVAGPRSVQLRVHAPGQSVQHETAMEYTGKSATLSVPSLIGSLRQPRVAGTVELRRRMGWRRRFMVVKDATLYCFRDVVSLHNPDTTGLEFALDLRAAAVQVTQDRGALAAIVRDLAAHDRLRTLRRTLRSGSGATRDSFADSVGPDAGDVAGGGKGDAEGVEASPEADAETRKVLNAVLAVFGRGNRASGRHAADGELEATGTHDALARLRARIGQRLDHIGTLQSSGRGAGFGKSAKRLWRRASGQSRDGVGRRRGSTDDVGHDEVGSEDDVDRGGDEAGEDEEDVNEELSGEEQEEEEEERRPSVDGTSVRSSVWTHPHEGKEAEEGDRGSLASTRSFMERQQALLRARQRVIRRRAATRRASLRVFAQTARSDALSLVGRMRRSGARPRSSSALEGAHDDEGRPRAGSSIDLGVHRVRNALRRGLGVGPRSGTRPSLADSVSDSGADAMWEPVSNRSRSGRPRADAADEGGARTEDDGEDDEVDDEDGAMDESRSVAGEQSDVDDSGDEEEEALEEAALALTLALEDEAPEEGDGEASQRRERAGRLQQRLSAVRSALGLERRRAGQADTRARSRPSRGRDPLSALSRLRDRVGRTSQSGHEDEPRSGSRTLRSILPFATGDGTRSGAAAGGQRPPRTSLAKRRVRALGDVVRSLHGARRNADRARLMAATEHGADALDLPEEGLGDRPPAGSVRTSSRGAAYELDAELAQFAAEEGGGRGGEAAVSHSLAQSLRRVLPRRSQAGVEGRRGSVANLLPQPLRRRSRAVAVSGSIDEGEGEEEARGASESPATVQVTCAGQVLRFRVESLAMAEVWETELSRFAEPLPAATATGESEAAEVSTPERPRVTRKTALRVEVVQEQQQRVLVLRPADDGASQAPQSAHAGAPGSEAAAGSRDRTLVALRARRLAVSVVDALPEELVLFSATGVAVDTDVSEAHAGATAMVQHLQVDNQLRHGEFPVLLSPAQTMLARWHAEELLGTRLGASANASADTAAGGGDGRRPNRRIRRLWRRMRRTGGTAPSTEMGGDEAGPGDAESEVEGEGEEGKEGEDDASFLRFGEGDVPAGTPTVYASVWLRLPGRRHADPGAAGPSDWDASADATHVDKLEGRVVPLDVRIDTAVVERALPLLAAYMEAVQIVHPAAAEMGVDPTLARIAGSALGEGSPLPMPAEEQGQAWGRRAAHRRSAANATAAATAVAEAETAMTASSAHAREVHSTLARLMEPGATDAGLRAAAQQPRASGSRVLQLHAVRLFPLSVTLSCQKVYVPSAEDGGGREDQRPPGPGGSEAAAGGGSGDEATPASAAGGPDGSGLPPRALDTVPSSLGWNVGVALVNVEDVPLRVHGLVLEPCTVSVDELGARLVRHYRSEGIRQVYRSVGSLEFLGDPAGLLRALGVGFRDLVNAPREALRQDRSVLRAVGHGVTSLLANASGGASSSAKKVMRTFGTGLAVLSLDAEYQRRRTRDLYSRETQVQGVFSGISQGSRQLGRGIAEGLTGAITAPVRGARSGGAVGLVKGTVRGIMGVAIKPTVGAFDFASRAAEGIARSSQRHTGKGRRLGRLPPGAHADPGFGFGAVRRAGAAAPPGEALYAGRASVGERARWASVTLRAPPGGGADVRSSAGTGSPPSFLAVAAAAIEHNWGRTRLRPFPALAPAPTSAVVAAFAVAFERTNEGIGQPLVQPSPQCGGEECEQLLRADPDPFGRMRPPRPLAMGGVVDVVPRYNRVHALAQVVLWAGAVTLSAVEQVHAILRLEGVAQPDLSSRAKSNASEPSAPPSAATAFPAREVTAVGVAGEADSAQDAAGAASAEDAAPTEPAQQGTSRRRGRGRVRNMRARNMARIKRPVEEGDVRWVVATTSRLAVLERGGKDGVVRALFTVRFCQGMSLEASDALLILRLPRTRGRRLRLPKVRRHGAPQYVPVTINLDGGASAGRHAFVKILDRMIARHEAVGPPTVTSHASAEDKAQQQQPTELQ